MSDELTQVARQRADATIDKALGALRKAAQDIGVEYGIPENINGLSGEELLGRMCWVPSMARDLRRAAAQELAKIEIERAVSVPVPDVPAVEVPASQANTPDYSKVSAEVPYSRDLGDLSGVTVQAVKALRQAGISSIGDLIGVPAEHLVKIPGIAEKSAQQIIEAVRKASVPA